MYVREYAKLDIPEDQLIENLTKTFTEKTGLSTGDQEPDTKQLQEQNQTA
jgi:chromosome segregation and condensation protein ScpB